MIIPARRLLWLATIPLAVVLGGRGEPGAIVAAWILMGSLLAAFVVDGIVAGKQARLRLDRQEQSEEGKTRSFSRRWKKKKEQDLGLKPRGPALLG